MKGVILPKIKCVNQSGGCPIRNFAAGHAHSLVSSPKVTAPGVIPQTRWAGPMGTCPQQCKEAVFPGGWREKAQHELPGFSEAPSRG